MNDAKELLIQLLENFDVVTLTERGIDARHNIIKAVRLPTTIGNIYRDLYDMHDRFAALTREEKTEVLPHMFD